MHGKITGYEVDIAAHADELACSYRLLVDGAAISLLGDGVQGLSIRRAGPARCIYCAATVTRKYPGGTCADCFASLARCDLCIKAPHNCHYHLGTCREPQWGEEHCMHPHTVYLALTSGAKVGVTRQGRERRRWVDQGASAALPIVTAPTRRAAGWVEQCLGRWVSDRTDWRKLVTGLTRSVDLMQLRDQLRTRFADLVFTTQPNLSRSEIDALQWIEGVAPVVIRYPVIRHAPAAQLETERLRDNLVGVLGQYLLFERGVVRLDALCSGDFEIELGAAPFSFEHPAGQGELF